MHIRPLSKELQKKAILELNEVSNRLQDDADSILEWLRQQPHLIARTEYQWIISFLRGCKFSLQKAKEKMDAFYTVRTIYPIYFTNRNPFSPDIQQFWKLNLFCMFHNGPDSLSPRRFLFVLGNGDPDKAPIKSMVKYVLMLMNVLLYEDDNFVINGQEIIADWKNMPYNYIGQLSPNTLKSVAIFMERAFPSRLRGIYLLNVPTALQFVLNTFKSFVTKKLQKRFHLYSETEYEEIYKSVPLDVFPDEYGGNGGPLNQLVDQTRRKIETYKEWFEDDAKYCTDELKRPEKSRYYSDDVEGSFRKLDVD